jgi:hypothetical protein
VEVCWDSFSTPHKILSVLLPLFSRHFEWERVFRHIFNPPRKILSGCPPDAPRVFCFLQQKNRSALPHPPSMHFGWKCVGTDFRPPIKYSRCCSTHPQGVFGGSVCVRFPPFSAKYYRGVRQTPRDVGLSNKTLCLASSNPLNFVSGSVFSFGFSSISYQT